MLDVVADCCGGCGERRLVVPRSAAAVPCWRLGDSNAWRKGDRESAGCGERTGREQVVFAQQGAVIPSLLTHSNLTIWWQKQFETEMDVRIPTGACFYKR